MFSLYFIQISPSEKVLNSHFPSFSLAAFAILCAKYLEARPENILRSDIVDLNVAEICKLTKRYSYFNLIKERKIPHRAEEKNS